VSPMAPDRTQQTAPEEPPLEERDPPLVERVGAPAVERVASGAGEVLRTGLLHKQGHVVKNWKQRFVVVTTQRLQYFVDEKEHNAKGKPRGELMLRHAVVQRMTVEKFDGRDGHFFQVVDYKSAGAPIVTIFQASTVQDADEWTTLIGDTANAIRQRLGLPTPGLQRPPLTFVPGMGYPQPAGYPIAPGLSPYPNWGYPGGVAYPPGVVTAQHAAPYPYAHPPPQQPQAQPPRPPPPLVIDDEIAAMQTFVALVTEIVAFNDPTAPDADASLGVTLADDMRPRVAALHQAMEQGRIGEDHIGDVLHWNDTVQSTLEEFERWKVLYDSAHPAQ